MKETANEEVVVQNVELKTEKVLTKKVWLNGFKLFGMIAFAVVFALFYFISIMFFISPKTDAKIFKFFGAKKAEEACYIKIYDKSQSNADLYNLILLESELENYEKELYYLNVLMNDDEYDAFCLKLDQSSLETINEDNIETLVYICNTNAYLINQKIKCMYHLGFDSPLSPTIRNYLKTQLEDETSFETSFATYVELVYNDATISKEEKVEKVNIAYNALKDLINQKEVFLSNYIYLGDVLVKDKIISQYSYVNLKKARYLMDLINESGNAGISKTNYENAMKNYNNLLNSVVELD